jgi:hypothetical protein
MRNEALYRNFENIPTRKGRGGTYAYIRWQDVADRMNEVFGTDWSSEVLYQDVVGSNVIIRVRVTIANTERGIFFTQEGFGGATNDAAAEAGTPFKSAYSKALKDACKKWGVGLFLDEDDDAASSMNTPPSLPSGYMGKELGVPPMPPTPPTTSRVPSPPSYQEPDDGVVYSPLPSEPMEESKSSPGVEQLSNVTMPLPPGISMTMPRNPSVSIAPPSAPPTKSISLKDDMPMSKVSTINTGEPEYISDVQKAALQSILNIKGVEYAPLAKEAFEFNGLSGMSVPEPDKLTYQEAVYVVKYGNDKFRKR